jgi:small conductance mechanosensitive channel
VNRQYYKERRKYISKYERYGVYDIRICVMEQITSIVEQITHWGLTGIWKILFAIIIWFVGKKVIALCMKFLKKVFDKGSLDPGVVNFTMSIIRFALYSVLILMVIDELGIQTTSLVTVFGSAALAIGMSLQGSLSNFAGGVLILIFKPFKVGDYIVVGNLEGTVRTIELLYTKLTTADNKVVMLPNGALSNSNIVNVGAEDNRRLDIEMSIGYSSDLKLAKNILNDILAADNSILKDKEVKVIVKSLDESCVTLETRAWVKTEDYWDTRFALLEKYKSEFDKNGIEIPFNQMDVHIV